MSIAIYFYYILSLKKILNQKIKNNKWTTQLKYKINYIHKIYLASPRTDMSRKIITNGLHIS